MKTPTTPPTTSADEKPTSALADKPTPSTPPKRGESLVPLSELIEEQLEQG